jgi:hypothetical protein
MTIFLHAFLLLVYYINVKHRLMVYIYKSSVPSDHKIFGKHVRHSIIL